MSSVTVAVATHKKYQMPDDGCYMPIFVGSAGKADIGYQRDDTGDNISDKNALYSELTGLYWVWKNVNSDYVGLVHYRRYLGKPGSRKGCFENILTEKDILEIFKAADIILPRKRNYRVESIYDHYAHSHYAEHLDTARRIIEEMCPAYIDSFENVIAGKSAHMFNMFIMRKELLDEYCSWLFPILFELEERTDYSDYDDFQKRFVGRISEILLDVWIEKHQYSWVELEQRRIAEVPVLYMGKKNTMKKAVTFIISKLFGRKYKKSA